jgi:hypothetical protein
MVGAPSNAGDVRASHTTSMPHPIEHMPHVDGIHRSIWIVSSCCEKHCGSI